MNGQRKKRLKVWSLPSRVTLHFGGCDGSPDEKDAKPILRKAGTDKVLARLKVLEHTARAITVELPEKLICHGLGVYEICVSTTCCEPCDCATVEFCGECAITDVTGDCNDCQ